MWPTIATPHRAAPRGGQPGPAASRGSADGGQRHRVWFGTWGHARRADGTGLLGCEISADGELWGCYLEKAVAAHCGGWDKINGGQCTHAWALLTGCREQYTIRKASSASVKYACFGAYNPNKQTWEELANSPQ